MHFLARRDLPSSPGIFLRRLPYASHGDAGRWYLAMSGEQLDLLTRRKAKKPPPAKEFAIHCMVADTLRIACSPGWIWWHTPNGELRNRSTAGRLKRMGVKPGITDILLLSPQGQLHALELKAKGDRPSTEQFSFMGVVCLSGGRAQWADSFEAAIRILKDWGAVRVRL